MGEMRPMGASGALSLTLSIKTQMVPFVTFRAKAVVAPIRFGREFSRNERFSSGAESLGWRA